MQQRIILREHSVIVSSCPSRLADFSKYPLHSLSVPPQIYPPVLLASGQARSWFHADGRANELWGTHRHVLGGLLIKLGNNEWTNTPAVSTLVCISRVSYVPFLSFHILSLSLSLSHILPPHIVWWGAKDMCASQGAPQWGRVPDKVTATKRWFLFLSLFLPFFFSVHISLLSFSFYLSFFVLYNCPIFLFFSFPSHLLEPRFLFLFLSFSIFPTWQPSWGMCSVIERTIQNNNKLSSPLPLTFHLPPSSPFCNLHGLGPMRRVTLREEMKDFHCEVCEWCTNSLFHPFLHFAIFLRSLFAILSVPPYLAMSQFERMCVLLLNQSKRNITA